MSSIKPKGGGSIEIPDEFLLCRDINHQWRPHNAEITRTEIRRILICHCGTKRTDRLSRSGERLGHSYEYPEGYVLKGVGRLTANDRAAVRVASVNFAFK